MKKIFAFLLSIALIFQCVLPVLGDSNEVAPASLLSTWDNFTPKGNYYEVMKGSKYGVIDKYGKVILNPEFSKIFWLGDSALIAQRAGSNKNEFVNIDGKVLFTLPSEYKVNGYYNGNFVVSTDGLILNGGGFVRERYGIIDTKGKFVIPMGIYANLYISTDDWGRNVYLASKIVNNKEQHGFIDVNGKTVIPFQYDSIYQYSFDRDISLSAKFFCGNLAAAYKNGKHGCIDKNGKTVIPFEYNDLKLYNGFVIAAKNGKYGVLGKSGTVIIPFEHKNISVGDYNVVNVDDKFGIIGSDGKFPEKVQWDRVGVFRDGIASITQNGKYGFISDAGKILVTPQWDFADDFENGISIVQNGDKYGLVNSTSKVISNPQWDWIDTFHDGRARVQKGNMSGFIDENGQVVLSTDSIKDSLSKLSINVGEYMQFDDDFNGDTATLMIKGSSYRVDKEGKVELIESASSDINEETGEGITWKWIIKPHWDYSYFKVKSENLFKINTVDKTGLMDGSGKIISPPRWDEINYSNGLFIAKKNDRYDCMDKNGKIIGHWDGIGQFSEGLAKVAKNNKVGYINNTGKAVIQPQWDDGLDFKDGFALVSKDKKWGYIDKSGNVIVKPQFDWAGDFSEGMAAVRKDGKIGFVDKTGKLIIKPQWDNVRNFSEGLAAVSKGVKWGYINKSGKLVIPLQWDKHEGDFHEGMAVVGRPDKIGTEYYGLIDKSGKLIMQPMFGYIWDYHNGVALVVKDGKCGYVNVSGKINFKPQWDEVPNFVGGIARAFDGEKWGYIDRSGKLVSPFQWDEAYDFYNGFARVFKDGKMGYIDTTGKVAVQPVWDCGLWFIDGYAEVENGSIKRYYPYPYFGIDDGSAFEMLEVNEWSIIGTSGKLLAPVKWEWASVMADGFIQVEKDGKYGVIQAITTSN